MVKSEFVGVKMSPEELALLDKLVGNESRARSDTIRRLIWRAAIKENLVPAYQQTEQK